MNTEEWIEIQGPPDHIVIPAEYGGAHPTEVAISNVAAVEETPELYITSEHEQDNAITFVVRSGMLNVEYDEGESTDPNDWTQSESNPRIQPASPEGDSLSDHQLLPG